jgi:hypothetical protein
LSALTTIMDEIADKIADAFAGSDIDVQVDSRMVLMPTPPTVDIYPADPFRSEDEAGFAEGSEDEGGLLFNVRARVSPSDHESQQEVLLAFMDDEDDLCIHAAVLADPTLNGHAMSIGWQNQTGYVLFPAPDGSVAHIGCLWRFLVVPARS